VKKNSARNERAKGVDPVPETPSVAVPHGETLDPVKVNNASLTELKIACDDAVKRFFSRPDQYKVRNTHIDVKLALGWSSVLVAAATGLYGWKTEFEKAKPLVFVGVIMYTVLTAIQTVYTYFVEGKCIFVGKRKTLSSRIETEKINIKSETTPAPSPSYSPLYCLSITYSRSSNGGKTLIKGSVLAKQERPYTSFFDSEGNFDESQFIAWVTELSSKLVEDKSE